MVENRQYPYTAGHVESSAHSIHRMMSPSMSDEMTNNFRAKDSMEYYQERLRKCELKIDIVQVDLATCI